MPIILKCVFPHAGHSAVSLPDTKLPAFPEKKLPWLPFVIPKLREDGKINIVLPAAGPRFLPIFTYKEQQHMQQKETERADDRIDEEFYEELSEEEIQDEIASLYRRRGYMDAETLCRIDREIRIAEQVLRRRLGGENDRQEE